MDHLEAPASSMLPPPQRDETVRYSQEEWNRHKPIIEGMYPLKGMCLKAIIAFLKEDRGFVVNERQLKRKIKDWKLEKKVKGDEMKVIVRKMQQRVGKNTTFRVRGQLVEPAKIERWQKRSGTLNAIAMSTPLPESPAPSTPSDISYNTVQEQEIRSPSPYKENNNTLGGSIPQLEENVPPSPFRLQRDFGHIRSQDAPSPNFASVLVEDGNLFEGQSPAPFTAPPSPVPSQRHDVQGASSNSSQYTVLDGNFVRSENDIHAPFNSSTATLAGPQPAQTPQKKRYKQQEELELTQRLNNLQSTYGLDHPATIDTAMRLGEVVQWQGRYRLAERLFKQCAESLQKTVGENDSRTLLAFNDLSGVFISQSQFLKAKALSELLYSRASKVLSPSHRTVLYIAFELAGCHVVIGDLIEAKQLLREIIVLGRATLPPDDYVMLSSMATLAELLVDGGELSEAERILVAVHETTLLIRERVSQLWAQSKLGDIWRRKGEFQKAEEALREVLEKQSRLTGPEHEGPLRTQQRLAGVLAELGRFVESEELYRDIISKSARTLGRKHCVTLEMEILLGEFLYQRQRVREAEEVAGKVLTLSEETYGPEFKITSRSAALLSRSYRSQGRLEEAFSAVEKAYRGYLRTRGPEHILTKNCEHQLIMLTQEKGQLQISQDGACMSMNTQPQIVGQGFGAAELGLSSSDLS